MDAPRPSAQTKFPTKSKPNTRYKFSSFTFQSSQDLIVIERQTYGLLMWLGDVGGLFGALFSIGQVMVSNVAAFYLKVFLLRNNFRSLKSMEAVDPLRVGTSKEERLRMNMRWDFENMKLIPKQNFFVNCLCCWRPKYKRFKQMTEKAQISVTKELDLVKFI